jgi:O-antigen biosynthesis protein
VGDPEEKAVQEDADATSVAVEPNAPPPGLAGTWLSSSLLLIVGSPAVSPGETRATLVADDQAFEIDVRCIAVRSRNGDGLLTLVTADPGEAPAETAAQLALAGPDGKTPAPVQLTTLGSILDKELSGLSERASSRALEFISAAPTAHGVTGTRDLVLSSRLNILRNSLRHALPATKIERDQPLTGNVDALIPIDDTTFFIMGWMRDGEAEITRLTAVTPEGERVELLDQLHRRELQQFEVFAEGPYEEPADAARFAARFHTSRPSLLRKAWVFELQNETGRAVEMYVMPTVADVRSAREKVLTSIPESALPDEDLISKHISPAIGRLQERARESVRIDSAVDHGAPPAAPEVSIVVPLYKRIDLVEHQLLQFDRDPELQAQELIYVLDSPELKTALADRARQLARLYRVPFRIVTMAENAGFGAATNAGASVARGRLLLLLNSDVLPAAPGWLGKMQAFHDATPDVGALGAKLLYEDDSLQHAGLYFDMVREGPTAGTWANMHYYKGLHKDLPAANVARPVPAVTAACLLIEKELFEQVGGMPDVYVQGDYEDSELCLRLLNEGRQNWYLPAAELYHLEGSSYSAAERGVTGSYNRWLQTARMGQAIDAAMQRFSRI